MFKFVQNCYFLSLARVLPSVFCLFILVYFATSQCLWASPCLLYYICRTYICTIKQKQTLLQMILIHEQIKYAKIKTEIVKMGGISKTNNVIRRAEQLANIEQLFITHAEKAIRAENQRNARRAQR